VYRPLGVGVAGNPGVGSAADGRLEIFVRGSDGHIISMLFSMAYPRICSAGINLRLSGFNQPGNAVTKCSRYQ
jgi:hypothetical protein